MCNILYQVPLSVIHIPIISYFLSVLGQLKVPWKRATCVNEKTQKSKMRNLKHF